jgi:hypothetical protein
MINQRVLTFSVKKSSGAFSGPGLGQRIWRVCYTSLLLAFPLIIALYMDLAKDADPANPESRTRFIIPLTTWIVMVSIALIKPSFCARWFQACEQAIVRLARRRKLSVALVGLAAFATSAAVSLAVRMPQPVITDEFCYLLAADTFAHGRLTNSTHPMWVHFETIGVIHEPTYSSKYPPGQGLFLAAGQMLTGQPIVGVWLSVAFACAAICWMLLAWLPPRWALLGGLLAILHPTVLHWSQTFWGGAVAMGGGALLIGAFRRLALKPRARDAVLMGLGLAVLANSRPFEGAVLAAILLLGLLVRMVSRRGPSWRISLTRIVLPLSLVLALTVGAMGYYNLRVTGSPLKMPYMIHEALYNPVPFFFWQKPKPLLSYRHKVIRDVYEEWALPPYELQRESLRGFTVGIMDKITMLAGAAFPLFVLALPLLALPAMVSRNRWMLFALLACAIFLLVIFSDTWMWPHYAAPAVGFAFILVLGAVRHLRAWRWRGRPCGRFIVRASLVLFILSAGPTCLALYTYYSFGWGGWIENREKITAKLKQEPGQHLVVVRYGGHHSMHQEWVFNEADIDRAKIVWAREMDVEQNRRLLEYFKDRRVWLLKAETWSPALVPYTAEAARIVRQPLANSSSR